MILRGELFILNDFGHVIRSRGRELLPFQPSSNLRPDKLECEFHITDFKV